MPVAKPLSLRLFLEGIEVPVIAAQVSINMNAPAVASIQIVPLDEALSFKPRTMVHLFFMDQFTAKSTDGESAWKNIENYRLMFTGEVVGFSLSKQPHSRSIVLQCLDFSSYWDACHATAIGYGPEGNAFHNMSSVYGSNSALFDDIVNFQSEELVSWLGQKPQTPGLQTVGGLAGGVIRMLEAMGGVPGHTKGVNDFFTIGELRGRILAQIVAEENDKTAAGILKEKVFHEWLLSGLQNMGTQVTFRDMLKLLFKYIYYDVVPNPIAKFDPEVLGDTRRSVTTKDQMNKIPLVQNIIGRLNKIKDELYRIQLLTTGFDISLKTMSAEINTELKRLRTLRVTNKAQSDAAKADDLIVVAKGVVDRLSAPDATAVPAGLSEAIKKIDEAIVVLTDARQEVSVTINRTISSTQGARLRTQVIRPDCWFAAPPRCNVIFPEQYTNLTYDRNYVGEVTRLLIMAYNSLTGREYLLADKILAPNSGSIENSLTGRSGKSGYRTLMDHELHTGIIPRSEWVPNTAVSGASKTNSKGTKRIRGARLDWASKVAMFNFFKYRIGPRQASISGQFNPYLVCGFPALVIQRPYILSPEHQDEIMGASGKDFIDQAALDVIHSKSKEFGAPSQLVGMINGISHTLGQDGGSTSVSLHHVRLHLGVDDEFVNIYSDVKQKYSRNVRYSISVDDAKANKSLLKWLVEVTPQVTSPKSSGTTTKKTETSPTTYTVTRINDNKIERVETTRNVPKSTEVETPAPDPVIASGAPVARASIPNVEEEVYIPNPPGKVKEGSKGLYGTVLAVRVVQPELVDAPAPFSGKKVFREVLIYEEVNVPIRGNLPVEEIFRPGWFSSSYENQNIGKDIYDPFFGTTSIVDDLSVEGVQVPNLPKVVDSPEGLDVVPNKSLEEIIGILKSRRDLIEKLSIERAVNQIGYIYGQVKSQGLDVDEFIRAYSHRPIATYKEVLGSTDLSIKVDQSGAVTVDTGNLGFHTLSVHEATVEKGNLSGLLDDPNTGLNRVNDNGKSESVPGKYDVRKEKRDRVVAYALALSKGTAFKG